MRLTRTFLPFGFFGHYLDEEGIENIRKYNYKSCGLTFLDQCLTPWWNFIIDWFIPRTVAPNVLTFIGFFNIVVVSGLMFYFNPRLDELMPSWMYFLLPIALFIYQTLDAIDGKQARRTNSCSPLGQLFDHGCDTFTTVLVPLMALSTLQLGCNLTTLVVISLIQLQLFIFCWMDLHFHVFPHRYGQFGVTEGQIMVMAIIFIAAIYGPNIYRIPIGPQQWQRLPFIIQKVLPSITLSTTLIPAYLVFSVFITILIFISVSDILFALRSSTNPFLACLQLFTCIVHLACQALFYLSPAMKMYPPIGFCIIIFASSSISIRIELAAVQNAYLSPIHWPVYPMDIAAIFLYFSNGKQPLVEIAILVILFIWFIIYLRDLILTSINDISKALGISCFSLTKKENKTEPLTPGKGRREIGESRQRQIHQKQNSKG